MKTSREELLAIAFKLFVTKGYERTSMVDLARQSGLSKGAFHHYFPRKQDLFEASVEHFFTDFLPDTELSDETDFDSYTRQCAQGYANALVQLVEHGVPLAAFQAFLWTMVRDNPEEFRARGRSVRANLVRLYQQKFPDDAKAEDIAQTVMVLIEGTGNLLCIEGTSNTQHIRAAFGKLADKLEARSLVRPL